LLDANVDRIIAIYVYSWKSIVAMEKMLLLGKIIV